MPKGVFPRAYITVICCWCGAEKRLPPSRGVRRPNRHRVGEQATTRRYCSVACRDDAQRKVPLPIADLLAASL